MPAGMVSAWQLIFFVAVRSLVLQCLLVTLTIPEAIPPKLKSSSLETTQDSTDFSNPPVLILGRILPPEKTLDTSLKNILVLLLCTNKVSGLPNP